MTTLTAANQSTAQDRIRPMGWVESLLMFGVPMLIFIAGFHVVMPALLDAGLTPFLAYFFPIAGSLTLLLTASIVAYRLEGNPWEWTAFAERFRLHRMDGKTWLWTVGLLVAALVLANLVAAFNGLLIANGVIPYPEWLPLWLQPAVNLPEGAALFDVYGAAFGGLRGNVTALLAYYVLLAVNILGEEFWWRGYVLPRQEAAFGRWTWLIHGTMWCVFHAFKYWELLALLPITLLITVLASRRAAPCRPSLCTLSSTAWPSSP
ncbi:MAG: type II CAAX prenyl endopeptidase Rce1 family protein [Anaerolineae bacterium]